MCYLLLKVSYSIPELIVRPKRGRNWKGAVFCASKLVQKSVVERREKEGRRDGVRGGRMDRTREEGRGARDRGGGGAFSFVGVLAV